HEDSRTVGEPGAVMPAEVYRYGDGRTSGDAGTDNPLFQNFPHETQNRFMLVETDDDLCLNCHSVSSLP
ncbi:MAG: cytochrome c3 family protein, partial [Actinomycetota bacterium]|nr:cytochrome c3 family protein [Actinomycetota bacterium]